MSNGDTGLRDEALQLLGDHLNTLHAVMDKEDLPSPIDLADNRFATQAFVVLTNGGTDRQTLLGRRLNHAHIDQIDQVPMQRAWDWRGRQCSSTAVGAGSR